MNDREKNLYRGRIIERYGNTKIFADAAGISVSVVNNVIRGKTKFADDRRERWHELLGIRMANEPEPKTGGVVGFFRAVFGMRR